MGDALPQLRASRRRALLAARHVPSGGIEAVNAGVVALRVEGVARETQREVVEIDSPPRGGVSQPLRSASAERTLADGGWVRWHVAAVAGKNVAAGPEPVELAAPDFDLLALAGRREVLVWANEWERDAPVPGAALELLWRTG